MLGVCVLTTILLVQTTSLEATPTRESATVTVTAKPVVPYPPFSADPPSKIDELFDSPEPFCVLKVWPMLSHESQQCELRLFSFLRLAPQIDDSCIWYHRPDETGHDEATASLATSATPLLI